MAGFYQLAVTGVHKTIRDAVVVDLEPTGSGDFEFTQGQYLTFRRDFDGTEVRRSYSICSGKDDGTLKVGIKKVEGGAFSTWANENLAPGMVLNAMEPMGNFHAPITPKVGKNYLGFAGGSGITPVLSILKTVLSREPDSTFTLVYANRGVNTVMFREELEDLKNRHMQRLNVIHVLESDAQDIDHFTGRVDGAKCTALIANGTDIANIDMSFICGPEPMMLAISAALRDHGLKDDQIKFELFASAQPGRLTRKAANQKAGNEVKSTEATITMAGSTRSLTVEHDQTILEAALSHAIDVPHACKAGVCSTCKCKVLEGEVEMIANHALEDYEVERGYVLSCQSFALSNKVVLDYNQ
jgi:ring-1,2-phenylacetyl-CoA epoxidase subunit PaaE